MLRHDPFDPGVPAAPELPVSPPRRPVADRMRRPAVTVRREEPAERAWMLMRQIGVRDLPVTDGAGHLLGTVRASDLTDASATGEARADGEAPAGLIVEQVMTWNPVCAKPWWDITEAARLMDRHKVSALPVVDGGRVVGLLTETALPV